MHLKPFFHIKSVLLYCDTVIFKIHKIHVWYHTQHLHCTKLPKNAGNDATHMSDIPQVTQLVTSHLLHSLYNIILRLASFSRSVFTLINSAASNIKNNTNFYTKARYKTP